MPGFLPVQVCIYRFFRNASKRKIKNKIQLKAPRSILRRGLIPFLLSCFALKVQQFLP